MAPLKVRKPGAVMFDLVATATKSFFIDQVLFPYIKKNSKTYLTNNWDNEVLQHDVKLLREAAKKDKSSVQIADASEDAETIQRSVCEYVSKALDELKDNEALTQFRFHILFDGYAKDRIETPLYTDVAIQIHHWAVDDKIKLYVFSNGWKEATKRYLQKTNHGDMNLLITDHFDTSEGPLNEPATFKKVVSKVKLAPEDILFLTHSGKEGYAAKKAGLSVLLIMTHRRDVDKLSEQEKKDLPYVRSFNEIIFSGDAPKAREMDGSSVVDDDDKDSDGKSKASVTSTTSFKSAASAKSKNKKESKSAAKSASGSKKESKSADGSKMSDATSSKKSVSTSKKPDSADTSGCKTEAGLSEAFSAGASKKSSKKSAAASASKSKSKSVTGSKKSADKTSKSASKLKSAAGSSSKTSSKSSSATSAAGSKSGTKGSKASSSSTAASGSKSSSCAPGSKADAASSTAGASKTSSTTGSKATSTGGSSKDSKSADGSKAGSSAGGSSTQSTTSKSAPKSSKTGSKTSGLSGSNSTAGGSHSGTAASGGSSASGSSSAGGSSASGSKSSAASGSTSASK